MSDKGFSKAAVINTELSTPAVDERKLAREVNKERRSESRKRDGPTSYSPTPDNSPIHKSRFHVDDDHKYSITAQKNNGGKHHSADDNSLLDEFESK